jgi:CSLREA domain-containing protein
MLGSTHSFFEEIMAMKLFRSFHLFTILAVLLSQIGLISITTTEVSAAPAPYVIPASPGFAGVTISDVRINEGSNIAFVSPGSTFSVSMDYSIVDPGCPGCIDEIEIGFSTGNPFTCIYTGIPGAGGASGSATIEVTAPSTPGVYFLGFDRAQHYSCGQALETGWWNGAPDSSRLIANVIVTTLIVNSTDDRNDEICDATDCTLREAINAANFNEGLDLVAFNIPSEGGVQTISPGYELPAITDPIIIDGYTQSGASPNTLAVGNNADIRIELNGDGCDGFCGQGLLLSSGGSTVKGLAIDGNFNNGIEVNGTGSIIAGNFFGLKADRTANGVLASGVYVNNTSNNTIGGNTPADRNVISNNRDGIFIAAGEADATNNVIAGNYIGTDPAGTFAMGNTQRGIFVGSFGRTAIGNTITGNLISGNGHFGVLLRDSNVTGNFVRGNMIGTTADGIGALRNGSSESPDDGLAGTESRAGVYIGGSDNTVGGITRGVTGNLIAFNAGSGVSIVSGTGNTIFGNDIFSNDGLGIDLMDVVDEEVTFDEVTFNHVGLIPGPNNYQNYPVLSLATSDGETLRVGGFLESEPNQDYTIDIFANATCDPSFFGEGENYIGSFTVSTDEGGLVIFDTNNSEFGNLPVGAPEPHGISATATGSGGTSEFSYCRPVSTSNLNWVQAQSVSDESQTQQYITDIFQEKWFKFPVQPGSTVSLKLTSLPGSAVSLHRDPNPIFDALLDPQNAALLSAEASDAAFLPSGSLPSGSLPSGSLPSG